MTQMTSDSQRFWDRTGAPAWVASQDALDRQLAPVDEALLEQAVLTDGLAVVDAGCGAAAFTLLVAHAVAPTGAVVGVDFSDQMLDLARRRAAAAGVPVSFVHADLETWDGAGSSYDVVVSRLGLTDSPAMLRSLHGVLVPGGRLVAAVFRDVALNLWMLLPTFAVAGVLPVELPPPGAGGPFALADQERTTRLLLDAGFTHVELRAVDYTVRMTGPGGGGLDVVLAVGPAAAALAHADDEGRTAARAAAEQALEAYDDGAGARLPASVWLITARA